MNLLKSLSSIFTRNNKILGTLLLCGFFGISSYSLAGEYSEKEIKLEISYLAKKLLDMSGKDSYEISSEAYMRPFIGICSEITEGGLKLTCVTPGTQAHKNGLKTGDVVSQMNNVDLTGSDTMASKKAWFNIVENMKTGEVIKMKITRGAETLTQEVTVGAISHPAFTLKVSK